MKTLPIISILALTLFPACESFPEDAEPSSVYRIPEMALVDFTHLRNTDRAPIPLWNGMKVYADEFDEKTASGNVFISGVGGTNSRHPEFLYGDLLVVDRPNQKATLMGNPIGEWDGGYILGDAKTGHFLLNGTRFKTQGASRTILTSPRLNGTRFKTQGASRTILTSPRR